MYNIEVLQNFVLKMEICFSIKLKDHLKSVVKMTEFKARYLCENDHTAM